jgi:hypothetical protein
MVAEGVAREVTRTEQVFKHGAEGTKLSEFPAR